MADPLPAPRSTIRPTVPPDWALDAPPRAKGRATAPGQFRADEAGGRIALHGEMRLEDTPVLWDRMRELTRGAARGAALTIDLADVQHLDGAAMALLTELRAELGARGVACEITGASGTIAQIVHLYGGDAPVVHRKRARAESMLTHIGGAVVAIVGSTRDVLGFVGRLTIALLRAARAPGTVHWSEIPTLAERTGADAVPIVVLINFLVGFVMGFQSAAQLEQFGANIFVADLVGLATTRELGPLMTAIIVCGRSGAAYAAELGSMSVAEEIDALHTMRIGAIRFLVFPRIAALVLVVPILVLLADAVGILGGLLVGVFSLNLTVTSYLNETAKAVHVWDVFSGVLKSGVFAFAIAAIACQQGLAARGGAEAVGRRTTSAVVTTLFALILLDAAFTILFKVTGL